MIRSFHFLGSARVGVVPLQRFNKPFLLVSYAARPRSRRTAAAEAVSASSSSFQSDRCFRAFQMSASRSQSDPESKVASCALPVLASTVVPSSRLELWLRFVEELQENAELAEASKDNEANLRCPFNQENMEDVSLFIQSPFPQIPSRFVSVNPNISARHLARALSLPSETLDSFFFSFNGSLLPNYSEPLHSLLHVSSVVPTLRLHLRLQGGGGDGGATGAESRDCYLNMYAEKKPDKVDPNEQRLSKWCSCALSADPLRPPCVADRLGNLFNKEPLVEALLAKTLPREFTHIKGLKDMIPIDLSEIPGLNSADNHVSSFAARFQCPITGLEFNGKYRFYALRGCGHVLSAKALKEVKSSTCLICHREFSEEDKIVINGTPEEVAALREMMVEQRAKLREKKEKKSMNGVEAVCLKAGSKVGGKKRDADEDCKSLVLSTAEGAKAVNGKSSKSEEAMKVGTVNASAKRFKAVDVAPKNATKEVYASIFSSSNKSKLKETYSCRSLPLGRN